MKRIISLLVMLSVAASQAQAAEQSVATTITDVVVFTDRAQITRKGTAAVAHGLNRLRLPVDAFSVDADAVTAAVTGKGEIIAVQYREIPTKEAPQEKVRDLETRILKLKQDRRAASDQAGTLKQQEAYLHGVVEFSKTQVPTDLKTRMPTPEELGRTLAFIDDGFSRVYQKAREAELSISQLDKDIRQLERALSDIKQPGRAYQRIIEVQFEAAAPQQIGISATYVVRHAMWSPLYRAAVPADLSGVDLTLFSRIVQKTGENWKGVRLSVSNVVPLSGSRVPEARSWWLDVPRPVLRTSGKTALMAESAARAPTDAADTMVAMEAADTAPAAYAQAERTQSELAFEYAFTGAVDVASGEGDTVLPVFTRRLAGDVTRYAVPRQSLLTYLVCETAVDRELLSGPLNVYYAGRYVGKMVLEDKKPGGTFRLGLGADRQVVVKKEKIADRRKETFFGKIERDSVVRELNFRIIVENLRDTALPVVIVDSVPVSRTDRITVEDLTLTPAPDGKDIDGRSGVMEWRFSLAPGAKQHIEQKFTVIYPKELPPMGL